MDSLELLQRKPGAHRHTGQWGLGQLAGHLTFVAEPLLQTLEQCAAAGETALSENNQLRKLLGLRAAGKLPFGFTPVTGRVIARSPTIWYSTVTIDHGTSAGVAVNDPVINGDGLVGRVTSATAGTAPQRFSLPAAIQVSASSPIVDDGVIG